MLTGVIPQTGIHIPFISAGGTSLRIFMSAIGILCNVGKSNDNMEETDKNKIGFIR